MAKAHWNNAELVEALRSREPEDWEAGMLLSISSLDLLRQVKSLPKWEVEMILDALQEHLEN